MALRIILIHLSAALGLTRAGGLTFVELLTPSDRSRRLDMEPGTTSLNDAAMLQGDIHVFTVSDTVSVAVELADTHVGNDGVVQYIAKHELYPATETPSTDTGAS